MPSLFEREGHRVRRYVTERGLPPDRAPKHRRNVSFDESGKVRVDIVMNSDVMMFPIKSMLTSVEVADPQVHESENRLQVYLLEEEENMFSRRVLSQAFGKLLNRRSREGLEHLSRKVLADWQETEFERKPLPGHIPTKYLGDKIIQVYAGFLSFVL